MHLDAVPAPAWLIDTVLARPARVGATRLLCIDGRSGSGKSTLARDLAAHSGAALVELESLYAGWDGLLEAPARAAAQLLEPLAAGQPAHYHTWNWYTDTWNGLSQQAPVPLLIVEGVGAAAPILADHASLTVWLEAPPEARKHRAIARDGDEFARRWDSWARQEERLLRDYPTPRADVVIELGGAAPATS